MCNNSHIKYCMKLKYLTMKTKKITMAAMAALMILGNTYPGAVVPVMATELDGSGNGADEAVNEQKKTSVTFSQDKSILSGYSDGNFIYSEGKAADRTFTITADGAVRDGEDHELYADGAEVAVIKSDGEGTCTADLPDGKYIVSTTADAGMRARHVGFAVSHKEDGTMIFTVEGKTAEEAEVNLSSGRNIFVGKDREAAGISVSVEDAVSLNGIKGITYGLYSSDSVKKADGTEIVPAGTKLTEAVTGEDGSLTFQIDLPEEDSINTGKYYILQESIPDGYFSTSDKTDIFLSGKDEDGNVTSDQKVCIDLKKTLTRTSLNVFSQTSDEQMIAGTTFQVTDASGNVVESWTSDAGMFSVTGLKLTPQSAAVNGIPSDDAVIYTLSAVNASDGYTVPRDKIRFFLTEEEDDGTKRTAIHYTIDKTTILDGMAIKGQGIYSDTAADIHAENAVVWGVYDKVLYVFVSDSATQADVDKFVTEDFYKKADGRVFSKVFIDANGNNAGTFFNDIRTTDIPSNIFVADDYSEIYMTDTSAEEWTTISGEEGALSLNSEKTYVEFKAVDVSNSKILSGIEFEVKNSAGETVLSCNSESDTYSADGLAAGTYTIHVTKVPESDGYLIPNDIHFKVETTANKQVIPVTLDHTKASFSVLDELSGTLVSGASMQLLDEKDTVVREWLSSSEPVSFEYLAPGNYKLKELSAATAQGYVTGGTKNITIQAITGNQTFTSMDGHTKVTFSFKDSLDGSLLKGAVFGIYDGSGKLIEQWESGKEEYSIEYLPVGNYVLKEISAPKGYRKMADQSFTVSDTEETQTINCIGEVYPVYISSVTGAVMEVKDSGGKVVDSWTSDGAAHEIRKLKVSGDVKHVYTLSCKKAASGYATSNEVSFYVSGTVDGVHIILTGSASDIDTETDTYSVTEQPIRLRIYKKDVTDGSNLSGSTLTLYNEKGKKVETFTTDTRYHDFSGLPVGSYTLQEESAPKGFKITNTISFKVKDSTAIQTVKMYSIPKNSRIKIRMVSAADKTALEGTEFTVYKNGKAVCTMETDKDGYATSKGLPIGYFEGGDSFKGYIQYTVIETKAPEGYFLSGEEHAVTMKKGGATYDLKEVTSIKKGKTGSGTSVSGKGTGITKTASTEGSGKSKNAVSKTAGSGNTEAPQTGDNTMAGSFTALLAAGVGLIGISVRKKRKFK